MQEPETLQLAERNYVLQGGCKWLYFGGCDYHRLGSHEAVLTAAHDGLRNLGLNVAASRLTTGNHPAYGELENDLAQFFATESATLVSSGYAAPLVAAQALRGEFEQVFIDERAHACLFDAARFVVAEDVASSSELGRSASASIHTFAHRSSESLANALANRRADSPVLLMTDGMFSHDGSVAPLLEYERVLPRGSIILVDDAHGAGVLGPTGKGTPEHLGMKSAHLLQTVTLSKAFGCYGGAVLGPAWLREKIFRRSGCFVGSTPLPLPIAHAARMSLQLAQPELLERLRQNSTFAKNAARAASLHIGETAGPIVSLAPESPETNQRIAEILQSAGILPPLIRYLSTQRQPYFRFVISSQHTREHLDLLADCFLKIAKAISRT